MTRFASFDGVELAYTEVGDGRPVILLHGLFSHAELNWRRFGTAAAIAAAGFRVILPDLRAHGNSAAPHDAASYPPNVLAMDIEALVAHLDLTDFDLGGYSLGARTTVRCLVRGMTPRRAVLAGIGLSGLVDAGKRTDWFLHVIAHADSFARGSDGWHAVQFMKSNKVDAPAVARLLRTQTATPLGVIEALATPTLVVCGKDDDDNGSAAALAAALPHAQFVEIAGNHMTAVIGPGLGTAIAAFLGA